MADDKKKLLDLTKLGAQNAGNQIASFVNAFQNQGGGRQYKPTDNGGTGTATGANDADLRAKYPVTQAYDKTTDYMAVMQQAANQGDWLKAANAEQQRNSKITGEGLDTSLYTDLYSKYLPENRYNFDPSSNPQYAAAKAQQDAIFEKIMNRGDYQRNPDVDAAYQAYLNRGAYQTNPDVDAAYQAYLNQEPFKYNLEDDSLYQQYRDQYTALGKNAMRDTMGQAAALTGGYGSTYAQQAGQQSYDAYLQRLNDVMPELYNAAYGRYRDEKNDLAQRYNMAAAQDALNYQRYRDETSDLAQRYNMAQAMDEAAYERYLNEQNREMNLYNLAAGQAQDAYNQDYNTWSTRLGLEREDEANAYNRRVAEQQQAYQQQQQAYSDLVSLIAATGYTPTDAELAAAGMTRGQANALKAAYEQALAAASFSSGGGGSSGGRSGGGGRRGRSSGGSSGVGSWTPDSSTATPQKTQEQTITDQCSLSLANMKKYGGSKQEMRRELQRWVSQGLPQSEANRLAKLYGLDQDDTTAKSASGGGKGGARGGGNTYTKGGY